MVLEDQLILILVIYEAKAGNVAEEKFINLFVFETKSLLNNNQCMNPNKNIYYCRSDVIRHFWYRILILVIICLLEALEQTLMHKALK